MLADSRGAAGGKIVRQCAVTRAAAEEEEGSRTICQERNWHWLLVYVDGLDVGIATGMKGSPLRL